MFSSLDTLPAIAANLRRLFWLRTIAIAGQILAIASVSGLSSLQLHGIDHLELGIADFGVVLGTLKDHLPLPALSTVVVLLTLFNGFVWLRLRMKKDASQFEFFVHLLVDIAALTALLYFTGGATNPLVLLYLLPVTIAATVLPARFTWIIAGLTVVCYSLLMNDYVPLPPSHALMHDFDLRVFGGWVGFIIITGLVAYFIMGMGRSLRRQDTLLAQTREQALKDQQLVAIGTLAASATHELGTPLEILSLLLRELEQEGDDPGMVKENLQDMREQLQRCKVAMSTLAQSAGGVHLAGGGAMVIHDYLEQILTDWRKARPDININHRWTGAQPVPVILAEQTLSHAILNILNNAADASPESVDWQAEWTQNELTMEIQDRGPGLSEEARLRAGKKPFSDKEYGLGLGLYLAHSIIGRFGGEITLRERMHGGLTTRIRLPLDMLAIPAA